MAEIYTETAGNGEDVVLIHGWSMHSGMWGDFADLLARHYRVTCVDLPGHGNSRLIGNFDIDSILRAILACVPKPAHWIGWSLGASIALGVLRCSPKALKTIVMIAGNAKFVAAPDWPNAMESLALQRFASNLEVNKRIALQRFLSLQVKDLNRSKARLKDLRERLTSRPLPHQCALLGGVRILQTGDFRDVLRNINIPALLILGELDTLVPISAGNAMKRICPELGFHFIADAGHMPFYTHSQETSSIVKQFLTDRSN